MGKLYLLLDSRAGILAVNSETDNMNDVDEDWKNIFYWQIKAKKKFVIMLITKNMEPIVLLLTIPDMYIGNGIKIINGNVNNYL